MSLIISLGTFTESVLFILNCVDHHGLFWIMLDLHLTELYKVQIDMIGLHEVQIDMIQLHEV